MIEFLSEENVSLHREYLRNLKSRYSILEKSDARLSKKTLFELYRLSIPKAVKEEAILLKKEIYLHEAYFSSFCKIPKEVVNTKVKIGFGSFNNMLFEAFSLAKEADGFLILCEGQRGLCLYKSTSLYQLPPVILALDLAEHAYFLDYHYKKEEYIRAALAFWDGEKIK